MTFHTIKRLLLLLVAVCAYGCLFAASAWKAGTAISEAEIKKEGINKFFAIDTISNEVFARINGKSFTPNKHIQRSSLRYIRLIHHDGKGNILRGEMICNKAIAADIIDIFKQLYQAKYPIERMVLIDQYDANDERSMAANNTSSFCYRPVAGAKTLSRHSYGMAIDINPLYNPCVKTRRGKLIVQPATAKKWADRSRKSKYTITRGDLCYRLFLKHGFRWGGEWKSLKDYQHFER